MVLRSVEMNGIKIASPECLGLAVFVKLGLLLRRIILGTCIKTINDNIFIVSIKFFY